MFFILIRLSLDSWCRTNCIGSMISSYFKKQENYIKFALHTHTHVCTHISGRHLVLTSGLPTGMHMKTHTHRGTHMHTHTHLQRTCPINILWLTQPLRSKQLLGSPSTPPCPSTSASWTCALATSLPWDVAMQLQAPLALHHLICIPNTIARHDTQGAAAENSQDLF